VGLHHGIIREYGDVGLWTGAHNDERIANQGKQHEEIVSEK
jgi:hypothetical protein